jgi:hypothetical protein
MVRAYRPAGEARAGISFALETKFVSYDHLGGTIAMSNPAAPSVPPDAERGERPSHPLPGPDQDQPNPFGPDAPNVREDDPPGGQVVPEAPPPKPPATALDDDQFAPDET